MAKDYEINVDFLPRKGLVYVDTSGLSWCPSEFKHNLSYESMVMKKVTDFSELFLKRGGVLSMPLVLEEIFNEIEYYKELKRRNKKSKNRSSSSTYCNVRNQRFQNAKKGLSSFRRIYDLLSEGNSRHSRHRTESLEVQKFISQFPDLSEPDRELVIAAINSGDRNGILTADVPMMKAYKKAVRNFGLEGCFVCDGFRSYVETI
jgi:hypothetical protein